MHVSLCVCTCMFYGCVQAWRLMLRIYVSLHRTVFLRQGLSLNLKLTASALRNKHVQMDLAFYMGVGHLNPGPHVCTAYTLVTGVHVPGLVLTLWPSHMPPSHRKEALILGPVLPRCLVLVHRSKCVQILFLSRACLNK